MPNRRNKKPVQPRKPEGKPLGRPRMPMTPSQAKKELKALEFLYEGYAVICDDDYDRLKADILNACGARRRGMTWSSLACCTFAKGGMQEAALRLVWLGALLLLRVQPLRWGPRPRR